MSETATCPEDGGELFFDSDHPSGIGRSGRLMSVLVCKSCDGMFAQQSDGSFSRAVPPGR
jgi:hypothetical protein